MGFRRFFERERRDLDLASELEAHVAHEIDDLVARGVDPATARSRALRKLGNVTTVREQVYESSSLVRLEALWRDVRVGVRQLRRRPLLSLIAAAALAVGIAANTAVYSLLDQALWRPLPVPDPQNLVRLYHPGPFEGHTNTDEPSEWGPSFSYPVFRGLQRSQAAFTGIAGARSIEVTAVFRNEAVFAPAHRVSGNYFEVLGVHPALGRLLTRDDDRTPGAHPVVVLSHASWMARYGGDPSVIGRTITVNAVAMTIVGVAPEGFHGEVRGGRPPEIYATLSMNRELEPGWDDFENRRAHWITAFARLAPGQTRERAQLAMEAPYRAETEKDLVDIAVAERERYLRKRIVLREGERGRGHGGETERVLLPGLTLLVLLIACANVAGLQLARAASRVREISVRRALGATRATLVRQLLVESCVLAAAGGLLGVALARAALPMLVDLADLEAVGPLSTHLDARALAVSAALTGLVGLLFGTYPAWHGSRPDVLTALKDEAGTTSPSPGARLFRRALVTGQLATSLLLLIGAGLLARTLFELTRIETGFEADRLVTFALRPELSRYDRPRANALYDALRERLAAQPGIESVSFASVGVVTGSVPSGDITVEGFEAREKAPAHAAYAHVTPGYFETMGIGLLAGRDFTTADGPAGPKVAIVNETFVRRYLGAARTALGRRFARSAGAPKLDVEIVGVVRDSKYNFLREGPKPFFYFPFARSARSAAQIYVRTTASPEEAMSAVRREVEVLAPEIPIRRLKTMRRQIDDNLSGTRGVSTLAVSLAALAAVLAGIGLYGLLAHSVAQRTREIGIRIALGARASHVGSMLAREVLRLLAVGALVGLVAAAACGRLIEAMLYQVRPWDPGVYLAATLVLGLVGGAAALVPARRALRMDPVSALRHD